MECKWKRYTVHNYIPPRSCAAQYSGLLDHRIIQIQLHFERNEEASKSDYFELNM